jgi:hypothetical protein
LSGSKPADIIAPPPPEFFLVLVLFPLSLSPRPFRAPARIVHPGDLSTSSIALEMPCKINPVRLPPASIRSPSVFRNQKNQS